jgi:hypothetical protein
MKKQNPKKKDWLSNLSSDEKAIYDNILTGLTANVLLASDYSNRQCRWCMGKGYYQTDNILKPGIFTAVDNKPSRSTPLETNLCTCIKKGMVRAIKEIEPNEVA